MFNFLDASATFQIAFGDFANAITQNTSSLSIGFLVLAFFLNVFLLFGLIYIFKPDSKMNLMKKARWVIIAILELVVWLDEFIFPPEIIGRHAVHRKTLPKLLEYHELDELQ